MGVCMDESRIVEILKSANNPEKVALLQEIAKKPLSAVSVEMVDTVKCLTNDSDVAVRFWARKVFVPLVPVDAGQELSEELSPDILFRKLADAQSHFVANGILEKIMAKRDSASFRQLVEYLNNCNDAVVISFLVKNLATNFPSGETITVIEPFLQHLDDRVVSNCLEGLEHIPSIESAVLINRMLVRNNHRVKAAAAKALSHSDPELMKTAINRMLDDKNSPHTLIAACHAIGQLKGEEFLPRLAEIIADPIVGDNALEAATNIGGAATIGYLESLLDNADPELKKKLMGSIETIKINNRVREFGKAIGDALQDKKKACEAWSRSIIKKISKKSKDVLESGKQRLEDSHINIGSISNVAKTGLQQANSFDIRIVLLVIAILLFGVLFLRWTQQTAVIMTSKEACVNLELIINQKSDFGQKLEAFNKDMEVVGNICTPIMKVQPWLNDLEKLQKFEAYDFKFSDYLEKYFPLQTQVLNWAVDGTTKVLEKVGELENFRSQFQASYSDFNAGMREIRSGIYSWQNFDQTASASERILMVIGSYRKKIEEVCDLVKNAEKKMLELNDFLNFEKIQEMPILGRVVKSMQGGVDEIVKALQTAQNELTKFKNHFDEENDVLETIVQTAIRIKRADS